MATIISSSGKPAYGIKHILIQSIEELESLKELYPIGSRASLIADKKAWLLDEDREWKEIPFGSSSGGGEMGDINSITDSQISSLF